MQGRPGRLRLGPACKGGRRCPQGATDASGLQADYGRPPIGHRGCRQQGQRPPAVSPQRGDAHGGAANGSRPTARAVASGQGNHPLHKGNGVGAARVSF
ncbi:hypothetical protein B296_00031595 [Ensete ventricosum]|uniref:Uncharacterized protein n=1 Tax=Ensete ventricosum TaxID=4639 RepID=A0A426XHB0_ENSVE|nr:hypothetical protein B296_00031595 [Ensete ventricosum]